MINRVASGCIKNKLFKCLLMLACGLILQSCTNHFMQPMRQHVASPKQFGIVYDDVYFHARDGVRLHGWWFPAGELEHEAVRANILFLHGNAQNISTHSGMVYWLTQHGYNVFIFDYRGYGWSEGEADIAGAISDVSAAREYVREHSPQLPLYVVAHSLGASLGVYSLAQDHGGVEGAIFVAPFSEYPEVAREMLGEHWLGWWFQWLGSLLVSDEFGPLKVVDRLDRLPKLFAYSEGDRIVRAEHVRKLYQVSGGERRIIKLEGGHNDLFAVPENQQLILSQLRQWLGQD